MRFALPLGLAVVLAGCSGNPQITGASVSGQVKYKGKPLTGGLMRVVALDDPNKASSGMIAGDGSFAVENVPVGEVKILIDTEVAKWDPAAMSAKAKGESGGPPPMKFMPIDEVYNDADKTPLRLTIAKGKQSKDVDIP